MDLLVISNGAGEDAIATGILARLLDLRPELGAAAFPLVGAGSAYRDLHIDVWDGGPSPPSAGLANNSWKLWLTDLRHGLLGRVAQQWRCLRQANCRLTVAVGDVFPLALARLAGLKPILFVGTAKSVYHHAYSWPERLLLRRFARQSAVRDEATATALRQGGVDAVCLGNPMVDETVPAERDLELSGDRPCLALFPGSRARAPQELIRLLAIWQQLDCQAAVAVAPGMDLAELACHCSGWTLERNDVSAGRVGTLTSPEGRDVALVRGALGDLLAACQVAFGLAGTAHEQAAAVGVPVVSIHSGPLDWYRGRQKGLLGDALTVVADDQAACDALSQLLRDAELRSRLGAVGRQRMGPPGGAQALAHWIDRHLS